LSKDDELEQIRQRRLAEMQNQMAQQNAEAQQDAVYGEQRRQLDAQKEAILQKLLSSEARSRLTNIKIARPDYGAQLEMQIIQAAQSGVFRGHLPLSDEQFKSILLKLQEKGSKRDSKIRIL
jgi:programmed cell death protein 5